MFPPGKNLTEDVPTRKDPHPIVKGVVKFRPLKEIFIFHSCHLKKFFLNLLTFERDTCEMQGMGCSCHTKIGTLKT